MAEARFLGNSQESAELDQAIAHNCTCQLGDDGPETICPAHQAMLHDQRWLNGLLFVRHWADRLQAEEFDDDCRR